MRQSKLFTKTRREAPKDEESKNAQLLIRAGYIHKEMAGVYDYLPLGLMVLQKIQNIIREEMNGIGGQEILMTTLQDPEIWKRTGRWDDQTVDNWFKTKLKNENELGIANTHEEPITQMLAQFAQSYKDLPIAVYQFQTKFRNELRAKSGIMRVREFLMKDLYSFSRTEAEFKEFYEKCAQSYSNIFERVGLGEVTYRTVAAGGSFTGGFTDEFQTISDAGEDIIYVDDEGKIAINKEVYTDETISRLGLDRSKMKEEKSIEVGNIFPLGDKYPKALDLKLKDEEGNDFYPVMGSYGIGLGRLIGVITEVFGDEKGIVWPESVSPFKYHLVEIISDKHEVRETAERIYKKLGSDNALYDDRDLRAGEKFADADLLGMPSQIIISEKNVLSGLLEIKDRKTGEVKMIKEDELQNLC